MTTSLNSPWNLRIFVWVLALSALPVASPQEIEAATSLQRNPFSISIPNPPSASIQTDSGFQDYLVGYLSIAGQKAILVLNQSQPNPRYWLLRTGESIPGRSWHFTGIAMNRALLATREAALRSGKAEHYTHQKLNSKIHWLESHP